MYLHCGSSECWFVTQVNSLLALIKWNIKVKILVFFMWKFCVELSNSQWKKVSKYFANNCLVNIAESLGVMAMHGCVLKHINYNNYCWTVGPFCSVPHRVDDFHLSNTNLWKDALIQKDFSVLPIDFLLVVALWLLNNSLQY